MIIIQYEEQIMLSFETIKRIMKTKSNGRQISDKAVVVMSIYVEKYVKNVTEKGLEVLDEMNNNREIQSLRKQMRLDDKCVLEGINIINQDSLLNIPGKQVGVIKEEKENIMHSQINETLTEVT